MSQHAARRSTGGRRQTVFRGSHRGRSGLESLSRQLGTEVEGEPRSFTLSYSALSLGSLVLTRWRHSPVWWNGSLADVGADVAHAARSHGRQRPFVRLFVVLDGTLRLGQGSAGDLVEKGGAASLRGDEEFTYEADEEVTVLVCDVSAEDPLTQPVAALAPHFTSISTQEVLVSAFAGFAEDLLRHDDDDFGPSTRAHVLRSFVPLVGSVLTLPHHRRPAELSQRVRRSQVMHYIDAHHHDTALSTGTVAASFGMSERSLQRLFEGDHPSVNQLIQSKRAERAVALLRDPRYDSYAMHQLARLTGHGNPITFRRAVLQATGLTPTALRIWDRAARPYDPQPEHRVG